MRPNQHEGAAHSNITFYVRRVCKGPPIRPDILCPSVFELDSRSRPHSALTQLRGDSISLTRASRGLLWAY